MVTHVDDINTSCFTNARVLSKKKNLAYKLNLRYLRRIFITFWRKNKGNFSLKSSLLNLASCVAIKFCPARSELRRNSVHWRSVLGLLTQLSWREYNKTRFLALSVPGEYGPSFRSHVRELIVVLFDAMHDKRFTSHKTSASILYITRYQLYLPSIYHSFAFFSAIERFFASVSTRISYHLSIPPTFLY